ncbi:class I SAM-dependent methyltransferase [Hydrogenophaga sp.]|uniref:class I SAM-dependent methyltransferase n=1 Tax=Hydrogenophaga sp. TaxID=1904254 RepID=UPI003AF60327
MQLILPSLIESRIGQLSRPLALQWPGGRAGAADAPVCLKVNDTQQLKWLVSGHIGTLADAYVGGDLEIEGNLREAVEIAAELAGDPVGLGRVHPCAQLLQHLRSRWLHRPHRDAEQVRFHYDLSDEFFALWLDPLRVYSCAYYERNDMTLAQAQEAKLEHICRKLQLEPGQLFLDIGAGWGGLLLWAAEHHGVHAMGITLSRHQHAHVNRLIDEKGLRDRVTMRLLDYRDLPPVARFDRIASVGMFEHVGSAQLDGYFGRLQRLLKPGGLLLNHGITAGGVDNHQLGAGLGDFIDKHIFPGGELVHVSRVARSLSACGLELLDAENLRPHYARTLWAWSSALENQLDRARELTSNATVRAYRLYLAGCAVAFERGWISIHQLLASRPTGVMNNTPLRGAQSDYPFNRRHIYAAEPS